MFLPFSSNISLRIIIHRSHFPKQKVQYTSDSSSHSGRFYFLLRTDACAEQPEPQDIAVEIWCPQSRPSVAPLTKKPEDSAYQRSMLRVLRTRQDYELVSLGIVIIVIIIIFIIILFIIVIIIIIIIIIATSVGFCLF